MAAMEESKYHVHMKMFTLLVMVAMLYVLTTVHHSDDWHRFFQQAFSAEGMFDEWLSSLCWALPCGLLLVLVPDEGPRFHKRRLFFGGTVFKSTMPL